MANATLNTAVGVTVVRRPKHSLFRCTELVQLSLSTKKTAQKITVEARANKSQARNIKQQAPQKQHHLWKKKSTHASGQKAHLLVDTVMKLSNEKEVVYGALDHWVAWEEEFPLIALAKALRILRQRDQWQQIIQVAKWMLSKGQGMTMGTYDTMILAFDMDGRVDEAEALWDIICQKHTRSVPRMLFSRMISMYERHNMPQKILEVFTDMEELGVKPDEGTMKKVAHAFSRLGLEDKQNEVLRKYGPKWKYLRFNGEQVRIRAKDL